MKFHYRGIGNSGEETSGTLEAEAESEALRRLEAQGIAAYQIQADHARIGQRFKGRRSKPAQREIMVAIHELTTLIESDVPLAEAVGSLAGSSHHPQIQESFESISNRLKRGESFADALEASQLNLPWYFGQLSRSGQMTGNLGEALRRGVEQMEYDMEVASELRGALVYPSVLVFTGIAAILIVFMVVVPNFAGMIDEGAEDVPWLARAVIGTGMWFNEHALWVTLGGAAVLFGLISAFTQKAVQKRVLEWLSRMPLIGPWLIEAETGRWASMLATLLGSRVELVQALGMAEQSVQLRRLRARLDQVTKATRGGDSLSQALRDHEAITLTGCDLVRVGEKTGKLPVMLGSLSKLYKTSSRERVKAVLQLIEPLCILVIGAVIGLIITGVILAITTTQDIGM